MNNTKQNFCDWYNEQFYNPNDTYTYYLTPEEIEEMISTGDEYLKGAWQVWLEFDKEK